MISSTRALAETVLMLVNARPQAAPALQYVQRLPSWVRSGRLASQKGCARGDDGYFLPHTFVFHLHVPNILDGGGLSGRGCVYLHASSVHCFVHLSTAPAEAASVFGPLSFSFIASYLTSLFFFCFFLYNFVCRNDHFSSLIMKWIGNWQLWSTRIEGLDSVQLLHFAPRSWGNAKKYIYRKKKSFPSIHTRATSTFFFIIII